ncbi:MAG: DUF2071 domain-containing protein [Verrucomicrobiota bacterium]
MPLARSRTSLAHELIGVPNEVQRLAMRARPDGEPISEQTWCRLLFLHWPWNPERLRSHIPGGLELDLHHGQAWITITAFSISDFKPKSGPAIPGLSSFHETNVRTYVHHEGVPGVWFLSLDASKTIPAMAARFFLGLRYLKANIRAATREGLHSYALKRNMPGAAPADFKARWRAGRELKDPALGSREFFLVERYCLYSVQGSHLLRMRIYHPPWDLYEAEPLQFASTLIQALGLPEPEHEPLAHHGATRHVQLWAPEKLTRGTRR